MWFFIDLEKKQTLRPQRSRGDLLTTASRLALYLFYHRSYDMAVLLLRAQYYDLCVCIDLNIVPGCPGGQ
ncbi:MAG: hypothetical protein ACI965_002520 [Paraglaciecola sp.]|jgi:hypothetical protein